MAWTVLFSAEADEWLATLTDDEFASIIAAASELEQHGPSLGRPIVDTIKGSRHHNMKELRSVGGHLRALFAFDPLRQAIVLIGGDKRNDWTGWYDVNIPLADDLYDDYLAYLREKGDEDP
jgi:hypothetical protein